MARTKAKDQSGGSKGGRPGFPFTAIVGQEELKLGILLAVIDPAIGGILITGHRGTAKSTAVRALAELLPSITVTRDCPYRCDPGSDRAACPSCSTHDRDRIPVEGPVPVVDLPLGATEDRVVGSVDIERALVEGVQAFSPGLLAAAHRGFLYIDEVNLLEDHLVDLLLDVAVSGVNVVEREGLSLRHPARFVLVGSGNPEEGDLRPQLLDRFGLHARITTITDVAQRVEIVKRRRAFDLDAPGFASGWEPQQRALRRRIVAARKRVSEVALPDDALTFAAELCMRLGIDGHRGELTLARAASALAALDGRARAEVSDIARVAVPSLRHRLRRDPLETMDAGEKVEQAVAQLRAEHTPVHGART